MYEVRDDHFHALTEYCEWLWRDQMDDRRLAAELNGYMGNDSYPWGNRMPPNMIPTTIPLISMTARAWSRYLVAKSPRLSATPIDPGLRSFAESAEASANQRIENSGLARECGEFGRQSLSSLGIMHIGPTYEATNNGYRLDLEMRAIDRGDWFCDMSTPFPETCDIQGHRFRLPLVDVRQHPAFDPRAAAEVGPTGEMPMDEQQLRRRHRFNDLYRYVDLACVYERRRNKLVYYPWHQRTLQLLEIDWWGPRQGPYLYLYFEKIPGVTLPIPPLSHLVVKHRATNMLDTKAIEQAQASKGCLFYTNASAPEARRIVDAFNNQAVLAESGAVRWGHIGGASSDLVAMQQKSQRDFDWSAGGLSTYAGLQTGAPTLGQERLLRGAANEQLSDMGEYAMLAMQDLCQRLFWYDVRDPDPNPQIVTKYYRGTPYQALWTREHRQFVMQNQFKVLVEPYSYVMRTPDGRLADVLGSLQILQAFRAEAAAQGIMIDVEAVVRQIAKAKNLPELYEVLILNQDPQRIAQLLGSNTQGASDTGKPQGRYERHSTSDGSQENVEMLRMLRGSGGDNMRVAA